MDSTRRSFLVASAVAPALVTTIQPAPRSALTEDTRTPLSVVLDLIIPAGDDMPSATQAGGVAYLNAVMQRDKDVAAQIDKGLAVLEAFSNQVFQRSFMQLSQQDRIAVLKHMEGTAPGVFDALRACVYESYYTQPQIWKLIGYELYPTDHPGPHLPPFDDSLIAGVRKMPKLYREV